MTKEEQNQLRADIASFMQPAPEPLPLPAAANRAALTPAQQEILFENWTAHIYARPAQTWTPEEKNAIRVASARALLTL